MTGIVITAEEAFHRFVKPFIETLEDVALKMTPENAVAFLKGIEADMESELDTLIDNQDEDDD